VCPLPIALASPQRLAASARGEHDFGWHPAGEEAPLDVVEAGRFHVGLRVRAGRQQAVQALAPGPLPPGCACPC
jgi:hypothetical protein